MRTSLLRPYLSLYSQQSLTLLAEATCWDDSRSPASGAGPGATNPTFAQFRDSDGTGTGSVGVYAQRFDDPGAGTDGEDLMFDNQLSHMMMTGSLFSPHVHWSPSTAVVGNVGWGMEYSEANIGDAFPLTTIVRVAAATSGTQYDHQLSDLGDVVKADRAFSCMFKSRIFRTDVGGIDTYASSVWLHEFDIHFEIDTMGTREEYVK